MTTRAASAAATRRALLEAAGELLDTGGLDAVTLRAVGARAGVSRGAPYGHFADKDSLLIAVGTRAWDRLSDQAEALRADPGLSPAEQLRACLIALIDIGRRQPHLYKLMFSNPVSDPTALARAAERTQAGFLAIVAGLVGPQDARRYGALLFAGADGIAGMEISNQLADKKWDLTAEELLDTLVGMIPVSGGPAASPTERRPG